MKELMTLKSEVNLDDLRYAHPRLLIILGYFGLFAKNSQLPYCITSLFTDKVEGRKSQTHAQGRAGDASVQGWTYVQIQRCIDFMNEHCGHLGAYSARDGIQRVIVYHNAGSGNHFHMQTYPDKE